MLLAVSLEGQMINTNIIYMLYMAEISFIKKIKQGKGKECNCAGE